MKYTLEYVKDYYKDASSIVCLCDKISLKVTGEAKIIEDCHGFKMLIQDTFIRLYYASRKELGLATIKTFKKPKEIQYEIY